MDYQLILEHNFSNAEWSINANDYDQLTWLSDTPKPTKKQLDDLWEDTLAKIETQVQAKIQAKAELLERLGITADEAKLLLA
jgi:hypothetical protein